MHQNIKVSGRRDSAKNDSESVKSDLNNFGNLVDYYGIEPREGTETLRSMFRMPHDCLIFYCLSVDFLCCISRQTAILISCGFLCFTAWLICAKYQCCLICWQQAGHVKI